MTQFAICKMGWPHTMGPFEGKLPESTITHSDSSAFWTTPGSPGVGGQALGPRDA